jgi:uncharacterized repeat protein (TIGR03843 family)
MVVFDLLVNNADRKGSHVLLDADQHVWLVDHGLCFHADPKLRTVAWDFASQPVPQEIRGTMAILFERLVDPSDPVRRRLLQLLDASEVAATVARAQRVAALEYFPRPSGRRPFPWPLL